MAWNHILGLAVFLSMPLAGITIMTISAVQDWRGEGRAVNESPGVPRDIGLPHPRREQPHQETA